MTGGFRAVFLGATLAMATAGLAGAAPDQVQPPAVPLQTERRPDVIFVPTRDVVIDAMLRAAKVTPADVVYDLGCGDGRIVVAAAKLGARAVGIDIDPQRIKEANENVQKNGVADKVRILQADLFEANISEATVVTLYLLPSLNQKLMPKLMKDLKPGTRIVSHAFDMGEWKPEQELDVSGRKIYYWTIPKR